VSGVVVTVSPADLVTPPYVPEIVTAPEVHAVVNTVKLAFAAPAGTVTLAGTVATAELLLESATVPPPAGAEPLRVTVPVEAVPPVTLVGLRLNEDRPGGLTLSTTE